MAVYHERRDPMASRSASLGAAAGQGLGQLLQSITDKKIQEYKREEQRSRISQGLRGLGISPEQSEQLTQGLQGLQGSDPRMLDVMLKGMGGGGQTQKQFQEKVQGLIGLGYEPGEAIRLSMLPNQVLTAAFRSRGFLPGRGSDGKPAEEIKSLIGKKTKQRRQAKPMNGKKLSNKVVDHFLKKAGGDPAKAKALAKKAGYKV